MHKRKLGRQDECQLPAFILANSCPSGKVFLPRYNRVNGETDPDCRYSSVC